MITSHCRFYVNRVFQHRKNNRTNFVKHLDKCKKALSFNKLFPEEVAGRSSGKKSVLKLQRKTTGSESLFDKVIRPAWTFI